MVDCEPYFRSHFNVRVPMPDVPKVSIIGASGKVARSALTYLFQNSEKEMRLVLVSRTPERIEGALLDIRPVASMPPFNRKLLLKAPDYLPTKDMSEIKDSNLVVVTAGRTLSVPEKQELRRKDPLERLIGACGNYHMMNGIARRIAKEAPKAIVIVVTDQSDLMSMVMRQHVEPRQVLGFGGMTDTGRFLDQAALLLRARGMPIGFGDVKGQVIGYHNENMMLLSSSLNGCAKHFAPEELDQLIEETKLAPKLIAESQGPYGFRNAKTKTRLDTGGSVTAGTALGACIQAFTDPSCPLMAPFNVPLATGDHSRHYGVTCGTQLSVPIAFGRGGYQVSTDYPVNEQEQAALAKAAESMREDYARMLEICVPPKAPRRTSLKRSFVVDVIKALHE